MDFWEVQLIPSFMSLPEAIAFITAAWSQRGLAQPWQSGLAGMEEHCRYSSSHIGARQYSVGHSATLEIS